MVVWISRSLSLSTLAVRFEVRGSRFKVQGSRLGSTELWTLNGQVQGFRFKVRGSRLGFAGPWTLNRQVQGWEFKVRGWDSRNLEPGTLNRQISGSRLGFAEPWTLNFELWTLNFKDWVHSEKSCFYHPATIITLLLQHLDPFPPTPFPKKGRGRLVLICYSFVNHGIMLISTPLPSLFGEGLGVGYYEGGYRK